MNNSFHEIGSIISASQNILITAHVLPDGDSIGSVLGLGLSLKSQGKSVYMVMQDKIPGIYKFLPGINEIMLPHELSIKPQLLIFLDCTDFTRAGDKWFNHWVKDIPVVNIDHHVSNEYFGSYNFINDKAAATAEIIYNLLEEMKIELSLEAATALYTGIVMDTGSFKFQNTTPKTLTMAASLLEKGINLAVIRENLYESKSIKNLQLIASAINNLNFASNGQIAWTYLDKKTMDKFQADSEHCEEIVNYPISIENVKIGLLFREMENGVVKVGLRCRTGYDVNKIAAIFGGGGHQLAAGCTLEEPLEKAISQVLQNTIRIMEETNLGRIC